MKRKIVTLERSQFQSWSSIARSVLESIKERKVFLNLNDSSTSLTESDCIRAVSEICDESPARNLLLKYMVEAEQQSPGSSFVFLSCVSGDQTLPQQFGSRFTVENLRKSLNLIIGTGPSSIVMDSISLAGRKGKVILDANRSQITEISYGSQICKWKPSSNYFLSINQSKVSVQGCRVVFVDGIIESVSECHRLFNESYEKKVPIVIFARGFAEEVDATAAINMQRQTAQVIPILIPFDEVGVNGMADLANCFSAELISSDKGQLISNIDISSCPTASRISCSNLGTEIEFAGNNVDEVIKKLTLRLRNDEQNQSELIRRRLDALGNGSVTIKIGNEKKSLAGIQRDRIDFGVRYVGSCMKYGAVNFQGIMLPRKSLEAGIKCAESFKKILQNCRVMLEVENVARPAR